MPSSEEQKIRDLSNLMVSASELGRPVVKKLMDVPWRMGMVGSRTGHFSFLFPSKSSSHRPISVCFPFYFHHPRYLLGRSHQGGTQNKSNNFNMDEGQVGGRGSGLEMRKTCGAQGYADLAMGHSKRVAKKHRFGKRANRPIHLWFL